MDMAERITNTNGHYETLSDREGFSLFDKAARYYLGIPGKDFLAQLEAGEFEDSDDNPDVAAVMALLPFARA